MYLYTSKPYKCLKFFFKILTFSVYLEKIHVFSFLFILGHIVSSIAEKPEFNSKLRNWNWNRSPSISNATESEVLVTLGQTAYLHCVVGYLGDRQVCLFCSNVWDFQFKIIWNFEFDKFVYLHLQIFLKSLCNCNLERDM